MSAGSGAAGAKVATVAEMRQLAVARLFDIIGGKWLALALVLLFAIILLADTFGLHFLAWLQDKQFRSVCDPAAPGPAGGFAPLLLGVCAVNIALASVISRRGVWATGLLLLAVTVAPFALMAAVDGGSDRFNLDALLRDRPLGFLLAEPSRYLFGPICGDPQLSLLDWINNRYTPHSLAGGQPRNYLAYSIFANLLIGLIWALVLAVIAIPAAIVRLFRGRPRGGSSLVRGAERTVVVWMGAVALLVFLALPAAVAQLDNPSPVSAALLNLLWIGPLLFLLDLARLGLAPQDAEATDAAIARGIVAPAIARPVLEEGVDAIRSSIGNALLLSIRLDRDGEAAPDRTPARPEPVPRPGVQTYLNGPLTQAMFDRLAAHLAPAILDAGGGLLVVCPGESVEQVHDGMRKALLAAEGDLQIGWMTDMSSRPGATGAAAQSDRKRRADIVVTDPEGLEELLRDSESFEQLLVRLGGVALIQSHALDIGLVRACFNRLKGFVPTRRELAVVVQSEPRAALRETVANLPLLSSVDRLGWDDDAGFGWRRDQFIILADYPVAADLGHDEARWPSHVRAMLAVRERLPQATVAILDRDARFAREFHARLLSKELEAAREPGLAQWVRSLPVWRLGPDAGASPVAIIDDRSNLADAVTAAAAPQDAIEAMTVATVGGYPASRFLFERLKAVMDAAPDAGKRRSAHAAFHAKYGSIMPAPVDGPVELMLMTQRELAIAQRENRWVSERRLREIWAAADNAILAQLGVTVGRAGLIRLFEVVLGNRMNDSHIEHRRDPEDLTRQFNLAGKTVSAGALDMLRVNIGGPVARYIPLADWGLSYAEGTRMVVGGSIRKVTGVAREAREIRLEIDEQKPLRPYTFVRDYASETLEGGPLLAAEGYVPRLEADEPHERATGYAPFARRTRAVLEWGGLASPFAGAAGPQRIDREIESAHRLRRVALLRLLSRPSRTGAGRPAAAAGQAPVSPETAFTLATTLSDILATLFPAHAHRLALLRLPVSANDPLNAARPAEERARSFALARMPRLAPLSGGLPETQPGAEALRRLHERGADFARRFMSAARPPSAETLDAPARLNLLLVEDSDHDLGVAKAVSQSFDQIRQVWEEYLDHCVARPPGPEHPYSFGGPEVPDVYDFAAAAAIVRGMR